MRALIAAALVAMTCGSGCDRELGVTPIADASFVLDAADDVASPDASEQVAPGCSLLRPTVCDREGSVCCAQGTERCVPGADGENVCIPVGDVAEDEACGADGIDDCAAGLLCAAPVAGDAPVCRRLCDRVVALCAEDQTCTWDVELAGQSVGLCSGP